jgi:hypothetical protein
MRNLRYGSMMNPIDNIAINDDAVRLIPGNKRNPFIPKFAPPFPQFLLKFGWGVKTPFVKENALLVAQAQLTAAMKIGYNNAGFYDFMLGCSSWRFRSSFRVATHTSALLEHGH